MHVVLCSAGVTAELRIRLGWQAATVPSHYPWCRACGGTRRTHERQADPEAAGSGSTWCWMMAQQPKNLRNQNRRLLHLVCQLLRAGPSVWAFTSLRTGRRRLHSARLLSSCVCKGSGALLSQLVISAWPTVGRFLDRVLLCGAFGLQQRSQHQFEAERVQPSPPREIARATTSRLFLSRFPAPQQGLDVRVHRSSASSGRGEEASERSSNVLSAQSESAQIFPQLRETSEAGSAG